jgi:hypothetical protein
MLRGGARWAPTFDPVAAYSCEDLLRDTLAHRVESGAMYGDIPWSQSLQAGTDSFAEKVQGVVKNSQANGRFAKILVSNADKAFLTCFDNPAFTRSESGLSGIPVASAPGDAAKQRVEFVGEQRVHVRVYNADGAAMVTGHVTARYVSEGVAPVTNCVVNEKGSYLVLEPVSAGARKRNVELVIVSGEGLQDHAHVTVKPGAHRPVTTMLDAVRQHASGEKIITLPTMDGGSVSYTVESETPCRVETLFVYGV